MKDIKLKHQNGKPLEINIKGQKIGRGHFTMISGPCTIENYEDLYAVAVELKKMGIHFFRGGAYKMRTSPYNFQGLGKKGLEYMKKVANETCMISVSEIVSSEDVEMIKEYVDILQVGTRNMSNYRLLFNLGKVKNPIILKRGFSSTIEEWLLAAEHIIEAGNPNVILCERGIRTYETYTRYTLDISAIPAIKELSNLPIIVDPSHSSGRREMIKSLSWAAIAAGADGLLIETHFSPDNTICDSKQTIDMEILKDIIVGNEKLLGLWHRK
ncbi:MAG: 3-deoxy-7-phosphoheptulonate synthase [Candidatus Cloacimonadota bacterium]|nr:3-deoxy-7-phosphoheptulonate synthase [Candidatus Cloacimonadota bacterium]